MPTDDINTVKAKLEETHQSSMLHALQSADEKRRDRLLAQLSALDWKRFEALREVLDRPAATAALEGIQPAPVRRLAESPKEQETERHAAAEGEKALRQDRVAALTVAGGQGTRLGWDGPKGTFPITPVRKKSLFQYLGEKIGAARLLYGCRMPWLVMTSPTNDEATRDFFVRQQFFGLDQNSVHFFRQNVNPILDKNGNLVLDEDANLLLGPDGHGGVFDALESAGMLERLSHLGMDLISYFQVDNPMVTVADQRFLGYHLMDNAEFSCKVIAKRDPFEGLGNAVLDAEGRPGIVEYVDLPDEMALEKTEEGELKYRFGSIAIHVLNTDFAVKMARMADALSWHVAKKKYAIRDAEGEKKEAECYKFEKFVFDCLQHARGCAFVEADRSSEFAPVKNAQGDDSPQECISMLQAQWKQRLEQLGIDIEPSGNDEVLVEVSPLFESRIQEEKG